MAAVSGIYKIMCKPTGKFYIGSSQDTKQRWRGHRSHLRRGTHPTSHLQFAWRKYGEASFEFSVLEVVPVAELLVREQVWLDLTKCCVREIGFNSAQFAVASARGLKHSPESRAKMSAAAKLRGPVSEETRAKLSKLRKGRKPTAEALASMVAARVLKVYTQEEFSRRSAAQKKVLATPEARAKRAGRGSPTPETRAKMSASQKGHWQPSPSAATRAKMSLANKGRKRTPETVVRIVAGREAARCGRTLQV